MSVPADRPLSLARVRALPFGAVVQDRDLRVWRREADSRTSRPGWFRRLPQGTTASYTTLWQDHRPLRLIVPGEATP